MVRPKISGEMLVMRGEDLVDDRDQVQGHRAVTCGHGLGFALEDVDRRRVRQPVGRDPDLRERVGGDDVGDLVAHEATHSSRQWTREQLTPLGEDLLEQLVGLHELHHGVGQLRAHRGLHRGLLDERAGALHPHVGVEEVPTRPDPDAAGQEREA